MGWFNYYGLIVIILIMIPNMVFAAKNKDGFENKYQNKTVEISEQIGRFACFGLMIFNIPRTISGFGFLMPKSCISYLTPALPRRIA